MQAPTLDGGNEHHRLAFVDTGVDFGQIDAEAQQFEPAVLRWFEFSVRD